MQIISVRGLQTPTVSIEVQFDANYTEVVDGQQMTYYVVERWQFERKRDVLSPTPEQATALHCPRCGAPLQKDTNGACAFCNAKIESGEFQWFVRCGLYSKPGSQGSVADRQRPGSWNSEPDDRATEFSGGARGFRTKQSGV